MKRRNIINSISFGAVIMLLTGLGFGPVNAQESAKSPMVVSLAYTTINNSIPYVTVTAKTKIDGKFRPVKSQEFKLFLDKDSSGKGLTAIGKVLTNDKGEAGAVISPALEKEWKANPNHTFIATSDKNKDFDETSTEISIAKARLVLDTADDKNVTAVFSEFKDNNWVPVKGVEIKIAYKRLLGDLGISDEQSYTTDSLGQVKAEVKRLGLPGDNKGNITLVAKVEDNDKYGNMRVEKTIPWGTKFEVDNNFFRRALWASRFHSPFWLVFLAYSIIITVWGTLIYLFVLILKIRKLGKEA